MEAVWFLFISLLVAYVAGSFWWAVERHLKKEFNEEDPAPLNLLGRLVLLPGYLLIKYVTLVEKAGRQLFFKDSTDESPDEGGIR